MKTWTLGVAGCVAAATAFVTATLFTSTPASAELETGQIAPAFTLPNVATGETHSLQDFAGQTVVLHWQSMQCPWDVAYQPMLSDLAEQYADQGVVFLAINSNVTEPDMAALAAYADAESIPYPILKDEGNVVADEYAAAVTPHMFVISGDGELLYQGGIEAFPGSLSEVGQNEPYLVPVLDAILAGETVPYTSTSPRGCSVKRAN